MILVDNNVGMQTQQSKVLFLESTIWLRGLDLRVTKQSMTLFAEGHP